MNDKSDAKLKVRRGIGKSSAPMRSIITVMASTAVVLLVSLSGSIAVARDLTITTWGGATALALRENYFKPFTAETGIPIVEDEGPLLAKITTMVETGNVTWDLVDIEDVDLPTACENAIVEKLDYAKLKSKDLAPGATAPCGVSIFNFGNVLAYDADKLKDPPKTWADFWNVQKWPGKRGLRRTPNGTLEAALMADGVAPKDVYMVLRGSDGIDRAFHKLDQLKPHILWWDSGAESINRLASGEYVMTYAWTGRVVQGNKENNRNFRVAWEAGFTYGQDFWAIVKGSPKIDEAYQFLNFYQDPKLQAGFMKLTSNGTANTVAYSLLDQELLANLATSPEHTQYGVQQDADFWHDNMEKLTERFNAWAAQ